MPFTNLNKRLDSGKRHSSGYNLYTTPKKKGSKKKLFFRLFVILLILFVAIFLPLRGVYQSARKMVAVARQTNDALKRENLDDIRKNIGEMRKANDGLNASLNWLFWVRFIPYFGGFYSDAKHFASAGKHELEAAQIIADSLDPYKAELGFTGQPTPGTDRVAQAVKILDKTIPQLDKIEPMLEKAAKEVGSVDVNKYPETLGGRRLRPLIAAAKNLIVGAHYAVSEARPAIEVAPDALGANSPKNYLLIFQNDKELRATGGFMTAYAFMKIDKGRLSASQSDDIYRLDERLLKVCENVICPLTPPDPVVKYLPEANGKPRTAWSMRDSNLSPDIPTSMQDFEKMYSYIKGEAFDGIILIDTFVVEELIKITGPVEVFGTNYSAENDKRCNCPNVIYELENYAQIIEKGEQDRKAILGTLMQQILARSLGTSADKIPQFIDTGVKLSNSKHILFYMHDQKTQDALGKLNWTGQLKSPQDSDYLHINDSNFAGGKSNLYVEQKVDMDINTKDKKTKLVIEYRNPKQPNSWLNNVINRTYVRVYAPKGSQLIKSNGSDVKVTTIEEELGKTVFEAFVQVKPNTTRKLEFEYSLPQGFEKDGKYPLLIQKQPGTKPFEYTVKVNGKVKEKFKLETDKVFNLGT